MAAIVTLTAADRRVIETGLALVERHSKYYAEEKMEPGEREEWARMNEQSTQLRRLLGQGSDGVLCIVLTSNGVIPGTITSEQFRQVQSEAVKVYDLLYELMTEIGGPEEWWISTTAWHEADQYIRTETPAWLKDLWRREQAAARAAAPEVRA